MVGGSLGHSGARGSERGLPGQEGGRGVDGALGDDPPRGGRAIGGCAGEGGWSV